MAFEKEYSREEEVGEQVKGAETNSSRGRQWIEPGQVGVGPFVKWVESSYGRRIKKVGLSKLFK